MYFFLLNSREPWHLEEAVLIFFLKRLTFFFYLNLTGRLIMKCLFTDLFVKKNILDKPVKVMERRVHFAIHAQVGLILPKKFSNTNASNNVSSDPFLKQNKTKQKRLS